MFQITMDDKLFNSLGAPTTRTNSGCCNKHAPQPFIVSELLFSFPVVFLRVTSRTMKRINIRYLLEFDQLLPKLVYAIYEIVLDFVLLL